MKLRTQLHFLMIFAPAFILGAVAQANMESVESNLWGDFHAGGVPLIQLASHQPGLIFMTSLPDLPVFVPGQGTFEFFALPKNSVQDKGDPSRFSVSAPWGECTLDLTHPLSGDELRNRAVDIDGFSFGKAVSMDGGKTISLVALGGATHNPSIGIKDLTCKGDHVLTVDDLHGLGIDLLASVSSPEGDSLLQGELKSQAQVPGKATGEGACYSESSFSRDSRGHYAYVNGAASSGGPSQEVLALSRSVGLVFADAIERGRSNYQVCMDGTMLSGRLVVTKVIDIPIHGAGVNSSAASRQTSAATK